MIIIPTIVEQINNNLTPENNYESFTEIVVGIISILLLVKSGFSGKRVIPFVMIFAWLIAIGIAGLMGIVYPWLSLMYIFFLLMLMAVVIKHVNKNLRKYSI